MYFTGRYIDWDMLMSVIAVFVQLEATMLRSLIIRIDENHLRSVPNGLQNGFLTGSCRRKFLDGEKIGSPPNVTGLSQF